MRPWAWTVAVVLMLTAGLHADEESALKAVEKVRGKVERDDQVPGKPVIAVYLHNSLGKEAVLKELKDHKQLRLLNLNGSEVTDAGLKELKDLQQLRSLDLSFTRVTDAVLKEL